MGWSNGSLIAVALIDTIRDNVESVEARRAIYRTLIDEFEDADCDTMSECTGIDPVYDVFFKEGEYEG